MPARILLVSDDANLTSHLQFMLEPQGHQTVQARSLPEALEKAAQDYLDLIVLDGALPGRSDDWTRYDIEFMKALGGATNPNRPRVLVLLMRGEGGDVLMEYKASPDAYCQRPDPVRSVGEDRWLQQLIHRLLSAPFPYSSDGGHVT